MEDTIQLKGDIGSAGIFYIIIDKFSYQQESYLVILLIVDKSPEVSLHCTILSFSPIISLRFESDREFLLDT